jgi:hypothetical protein
MTKLEDQNCWNFRIRSETIWQSCRLYRRSMVKWHVSDQSEPGMGPKWTSGNHGPCKGQVQRGWKFSVPGSTVFAWEEEQRVPRWQLTELFNFNSEHGDAALDQSCSTLYQTTKWRQHSTSQCSLFWLC